MQICCYKCLFTAIMPEGQKEEEDYADAAFQDSKEVISPNTDSQNNQSQIGQTRDSQPNLQILHKKKIHVKVIKRKEACMTKSAEINIPNSAKKTYQT